MRAEPFQRSVDLLAGVGPRETKLVRELLQLAAVHEVPEEEFSRNRVKREQRVVDGFLLLALRGGGFWPVAAVLN